MASAGNHRYAKALVFEESSDYNSGESNTLVCQNGILYFNGKQLSSPQGNQFDIFTANKVTRLSGANIHWASNLVVLPTTETISPTASAGQGFQSDGEFLYYNGIKISAFSNIYQDADPLTSNSITPLSNTAFVINSNLIVPDAITAYSDTITLLPDTLHFSNAAPNITFDTVTPFKIQPLNQGGTVQFMGAKNAGTDANVSFVSTVATNSPGTVVVNLKFKNTGDEDDPLANHTVATLKSSQTTTFSGIASGGGSMTMMCRDPTQSGTSLTDTQVTMIQANTHTDANTIVIAPETVAKVGIMAGYTPGKTFQIGSNGAENLYFDNASNTLALGRFSKIVTPSNVWVQGTGGSNVTIGPITPAGTGSIAIGGGTMTSSNSVGIGWSLGTVTDGSVHIGYNARSGGSSENVISIGRNSKAGVDCISIGSNAGTLTSVSAISIGEESGAISQGSRSVAIGNQAGQFSQKLNCVAIGYLAGQSNQNQDSVAIGAFCGESSQDQASVAIGVFAGECSQRAASISIGRFAGQNFQNNNSIAIGNETAVLYQNAYSIAVGTAAGRNYQNTNAVAIGYRAGYQGQYENSIAIGRESGRYQQESNCVSIGNVAGRTTQGSESIAIGASAGESNQDSYCVAIGSNVAVSNQGVNSIAIGNDAGNHSQNAFAVAIGNDAGRSAQSSYCIAIGNSAGKTNQGSDSIAIGAGSGTTSQGTQCVSIGVHNSPNQTGQEFAAVSIGHYAGNCNQGSSSIAIGRLAGNNAQGDYSVAIGDESGKTDQGNTAVAIGNNAGRDNQGDNAIAIGRNAGETNQSTAGNGIAIGVNAAFEEQKDNAIAIGTDAGKTNQGANSIAIGRNAGETDQSPFSIVINATAGILNGDGGQNRCYIKPIRADNSQFSNLISYNSTTGELKHTTKTFVIDHPDDKEKYLVHGCLEGPEGGVYYRGRGEVGTPVKLPNYVPNLIKGEPTIQVTPIYNGSVRTLNCSEYDIKTNSFEVFGTEGPFYWTFTAKRCDVNVEPLKAETNVNGDGPYLFTTN